MTAAGHDDAGRDTTPGPREENPGPPGKTSPGAALPGEALPGGAFRVPPDPEPAPDPEPGPPGPWPGTGAFTIPPGRSGPGGRIARAWRDSRGDVVAALAVIGVCLVAGVIVALVWSHVAPRVEIVALEDGRTYPVSAESETAIGQDGWFAVCAVVAGLVLAVPAFWWLRRYGVGAAVGLALGGLAGGYLALRLGVDLLGPDPVAEQVGRIGTGVRFDEPLDLRAKGVLYLWPLASLIVYLGLAAGFPYEEQHPRQAWQPPYAPTR